MSILGSLGGLFGIGDSHGDYYKQGELQAKGTKSLAEMLDAARGGKVNTAGRDLMAGKSLADVLSSLNGDETAGLASSPVFGNLVAQQQVLNDPFLSGLYGKGGSRDAALADEARLRDQGFQLQPEDIEAYGQASGNIARMFGRGEQNLAQALASRGLAAAPSGAAGAAFSGLMGNKNEQLAQMQMQIANKRMENTRARLADTRNYMTQLSSMGLGAENTAFNQNMEGVKNRQGLAESLAKNERSDYDSVESARQESMKSQQGAEKKNLGDALATGVYQGVQGGIKSKLSGAFGPKLDEGGVPGGYTGGAGSKYGSYA